MFVLFFISVIIIIFHLFGYPLIIFLIKKLKNQHKKEIPKETYYPTATMICPAYNEEDEIGEKIDTFLQVKYPKDKIKLIIVSDDSTDKTNEIVKQYAKKHNNIELVVQKPRAGKPSAHNLIEKEIESEVVFLSDATALLKEDSLIHLVKNFADERIGLVSAKLNYLERKNGKSSGEGLYWKYESMLRKLESEVYSTTVASGALFAIRRELFTQIHPASPDDFERPLIAMENGFRVYYEDNAIVNEYLEEKNSTEIKRKIRIISREWFALFRHISLLNPFSFPAECFILFSHKIIRWLLPFFSLAIFCSNILLLYRPFYQVTLGSHILIYILGILGLLIENKTKQNKLLKLPAYWVSMNYAAFMGFIKFVVGKQQSTWKTSYGDQQ